ncbi:MAG TPA: FRG domain-containing protein [Vicinamibacterales bacterium]|nr:FRG domain-containing protein [Vicinamibacterales bacterium]
MPAIPEHRVGTWKELTELVYEGSWNVALQRHRSTLAFRGMGHAADDLRTSLLRLGGPTGRVEGHLLRNFRKYAQCELGPGDRIWSWLAMAQHHGLPTRLLDWTYSPFVAMHFATDNLESFDHDGVIWCVDYDRTNRLLPDVLKQQLQDEGSYVFTADMLGRAANTLQEFDALSGKDFLLFFEPPSLDNRTINQFALFSLLSSPRARLDVWLEQVPEAVRRIIIPAPLKWEIRDKLDQANINERVLFPGLEGLSRWLRRYYMPR